MINIPYGGKGEKIMTANIGRKRNSGLKLISVILALLLWFYIGYQEQGKVGQDYVEVKLRYLNLGEGLTVTGPENVSLRIWGAFRETPAATAYVNLEGLDEGEYNLPVKVKAVENAMFTSVEPNHVTLTLSRNNNHSLKIETVVLQSPLPAYQVLDLMVVPEKCLISGEQKQVEQVERIVCYLQLAGITQSSTLDVPLKALNKNGQPVEQGIRLHPAKANVYAAIGQNLERKTVSVKAITKGNPEEGCQLASLRLEPDKVELLGVKDQLAGIDEIGTKEIDLNGKNQSFVQEVEVQNLGSIKVFPSKLTVEAVIEKSTEAGLKS